jgi:DegV family protein with EDD domain
MSGEIMNRIAIVTDSAACLPKPLIRQYGIHVVPFGLIWGHEVFRDGVDMTPAEFYHRLRESPTLPATSQPLMGEFLSLYQSLAQEAEGIVSIHLAQTMSGTYNTAQTAARMLAEMPVQVVDSGTAVMAQGFVVLAAARAAQAGGTPDQVVQAAEAMMTRVHLLAVQDRLDYLARSGRVPNVIALVGSALRIVPIFAIRHGEVSVVGQARSKPRAVQSMLDQMAAQAGNRPVHAAVFHADVPDEAEELRGTIAIRFDCLETFVTEFTPVMGAHTGPGLLGVAFYTE